MSIGANGQLQVSASSIHLRLPTAEFSYIHQKLSFPTFPTCPTFSYIHLSFPPFILACKQLSFPTRASFLEHSKYYSNAPLFIFRWFFLQVNVQLPVEERAQGHEDLGVPEEKKHFSLLVKKRVNLRCHSIGIFMAKNWFWDISPCISFEYGKSAGKYNTS